MTAFDHAYQRLLLATLSGQRRQTRTVLRSTGTSVDALTVFAPPPLVLNLTDDFPALTLRRISLKVVAAELLWFTSGSTNAADLRAMGAGIWDEWAREDGDLGPIYGAQWRAFHGRDGRVYDQIAVLVEDIAAVAANPAHPAARRLLLTGYNPADAQVAALPPCHVLAQWDVDHDRRALSCQVVQRSADVYLGLPYNVASYALLTHLLARVSGLVPGTLTHVIGNAHLYANHVDQAHELLRRRPMASPGLRISHVDSTGLVYRDLRWDGQRFGLTCALVPRSFLPLQPDHCALVDYHPHPALSGEVAV